MRLSKKKAETRPISKAAKHIIFIFKWNHGEEDYSYLVDEGTDRRDGGEAGQEEHGLLRLEEGWTDDRNIWLFAPDGV